MSNPVHWSGSVPTECPLSGDKLTTVFYDANLKRYGWGCWSESTFKTLGGRLGTGLGQKYERQANGRWLKVEG